LALSLMLAVQTA